MFAVFVAQCVLIGFQLNTAVRGYFSENNSELAWGVAPALLMAFSAFCVYRTFFPHVSEAC